MNKVSIIILNYNTFALTSNCIRSVIEMTKGTVRVLAPLVVGRKGEYYQMLYDLLGKGYETVVIDGGLTSRIA